MRIGNQSDNTRLLYSEQAELIKYSVCHNPSMDTLPFVDLCSLMVLTENIEERIGYKE